MRNSRTYGGVPRCLDPQKFLPGLDAQVTRRFSRTLRQEAMLPLIHILRFAHHAEHRLVHFESQGAARPVAYVALEATIRFNSHDTLNKSILKV